MSHQPGRLIRLDRCSVLAAGRERTLLREISLQLQAGESAFVCGPNGSGKSTLLHLLAGLIEPAEGMRYYDSPIPPALVMSNPEHQLFASQVDADLAFSLENRAVPQKQMQSEVVAQAGRFGIDYLLGRTTATLSGGEAAQVALAGATIDHASLLLLDESELFLDPETAQRLDDLVDNLSRSRGIGVIRAVADRHRVPGQSRLLRLEGGELVFDGRAASESRPVPVQANRSLSRPEAVASTDQLQLQEISFAYPGGEPLLKAISLTIGAGEIVGLSGPVGSGKTTLARIGSGLLSPTSGSVAVTDSGSVRSLRLDPTRVSYVLQQPERQFCMPTVREELLLASQYLSRPFAADEMGGLCDRLGIASHLLSASPGDLSTGEQRRVALASILLIGARFLWLDEPTAGLDDDGVQRLCEELWLRAASGTGMIVISHDRRLPDLLASRSYVLSEGRLRPAETNPQ